MVVTIYKHDIIPVTLVHGGDVPCSPVQRRDGGGRETWLCPPLYAHDLENASGEELVQRVLAHRPRDAVLVGTMAENVTAHWAGHQEHSVIE